MESTLYTRIKQKEVKLGADVPETRLKTHVPGIQCYHCQVITDTAVTWLVVGMGFTCESTMASICRCTRLSHYVTTMLDVVHVFHVESCRITMICDSSKMFQVICDA